MIWDAQPMHVLFFFNKYQYLFGYLKQKAQVSEGKRVCLQKIPIATLKPLILNMPAGHIFRSLLIAWIFFFINSQKKKTKKGENKNEILSKITKKGKQIKKKGKHVLPRGKKETTKHTNWLYNLSVFVSMLLLLLLFST